MVHLHAKSCYSLLESPSKIEAYVDACIALGFRHVVLTDHNSMFGTMEFWNICQKKGVHPIIGLETEITMEDKEFHFIFLAKNDKGLQGLYRLSTICMSDEEKTFEKAVSLTQDCFVLTSSDWMDTLDDFIIREQKEAIESFLTICQSNWKDFYVSISYNDSSYHRKYNQYLKALCKEMNIPTVALSRVYYLKKEDVEKVKILQAIDKGTNIYDQSLNVINGRYLRSSKEMEALYEKEDLIQTETIASNCNVHMAFERNSLPVFKNKLNVDSKTYLINLCKKGLQKRLNNQYKKEYAIRLDYELKQIIDMGFTDYFLIVWDYIRYARSQDIYVGPGRGSAAGSLVAYCLGITHVDPIKNNLLFERFLNPERVTMPDIDTDFPDDRRDDVIRYVMDLYGNKRATHIVAYNTMKAKAVLRDVGRAFMIPVRKVDTMTKLIGNSPNMTLEKAYNESAGFRRLVDNDPVSRDLYYKALPLEGLPRHTTIHAGGVVLSREDIENVCPLMQIDQDVYATQFTKDYLEDLGLIKMDFLSVRNLTIIHDIVEHIQIRTGRNLDILKLPLNDSKTYQLLSNGDTYGIFQMESQGIRNLLQKMKPNKFEDICAVLALYRPGPMKNIDIYIERKEDPSKTVYPHAKLEGILKETYGIMIYQEQIMQTAQIIGGFTLAQADTLRAAMSKKKKSQMDAYREQFIQGALKNKCTYKQAGEIFDLMERFAEYGFNKSHSYVYGLIVYQMAYLKANYPLYFYCCLLNGVIGSTEKMSEYIFECQRRNIEVLPCSVVHSGEGFEIEEKAIRMPLVALKGIDKKISATILEEREKEPYEDYMSFVVRAMANDIKEEHLYTLIDGGALDDFHENRATMKENLQQVMNYASLVITPTKEGIILKYEIVHRPPLMRIKENVQQRIQKEFD
ncbi:MAG: DNA polymerase III subunit alpha, partial [Holdemanella sp.]|nr:DNA polymerase III subunit alpha [Holdemanella sp.]